MKTAIHLQKNRVCVICPAAPRKPGAEVSDRCMESEKHITWGCSDDLESRFRKTLYCGENENCFFSTPSVSLTDAAVTMYLDAAPSPKRRLSPRYASSIAKKMPISPCTIILGLLYSERLKQNNNTYLDCMSSSDLFVVSMLIASKYLVDEGESDEIYNDEWAAAGGLAVSTINRLEIEFLCALDWKLFVSPKEFLEFSNVIETRIAVKHGCQRGWFSYTDITHCLDTLQLHWAFMSVVECTLKVVVSCAMAYGVSVALVAAASAGMSEKSSSKVDTPMSNQDSSDSATGLHPYSSRCITRDRTNDLQRSDGYAKTEINQADTIADMISLDSNLTHQSPDTNINISPYNMKSFGVLSWFNGLLLLGNGSTSWANATNSSDVHIEQSFLPLFETRFEPSHHISWFQPSAVAH